MLRKRAKDGKFVVFFEDGTSTICDVLVGADGGNSRVRKQFLPQAERIDTDYCGIQGKTLLTDEVRHLLPQRLFDGPASVIAPKGYGMFIVVQEFQHKPFEGCRRMLVIWDIHSTRPRHQRKALEGPG